MKNNDKIVAHVYSTFDYEKFSFFEENRGAKETKGYRKRRGNAIQRQIDNGEYYEELGIIYCNPDFRIFDGRHNFEIRKRNKKEIRYIIVNHPDFKQKDLLDSVYNLNVRSSSWSVKDTFTSAYESKREVAVLIMDIIKKYKYSFSWMEVLMILKNDFSMLSSWGRSKVKTKIFKDKSLIERSRSKEFQRDFSIFLRINDKLRGTQRKIQMLRCIYSIIYKSTLLDDYKMVKALEEMSDNKLRAYKDKDSFTIDLIRQYNSTNGESVRPEAVIDQMKNFGKGKNVKVGK